MMMPNLVKESRKAKLSCKKTPEKLEGIGKYHKFAPLFTSHHGVDWI